MCFIDDHTGGKRKMEDNFSSTSFMVHFYLDNIYIADKSLVFPESVLGRCRAGYGALDTHRPGPQFLYL